MTEPGCGLRATGPSLGLMTNTAMDGAPAMNGAPAAGRPGGAMDRTGGAKRRGVLLRPAVWAGIVLGVLGFADPGPFVPTAAPTWILPLLALSYLVIGGARGRLRRPGVLRRQTAGLVGFGVVALVTLLVDPIVGQYLVAAGWFGHAGWDFAHRDATVVPHCYVDFCIPVDLLMGASLVAAALL